MLFPVALALLAPGAPVEALLYSTMPSMWADRMTLAMDGDEKTAFRSYHGMSRGDGFTVLLSRPIRAKSIRIETGEADGVNRLDDASLETSADGTTFVKAAAFESGVAEARPKGDVAAFRIRVAHGVPRLVVREIAVDSPTPVAHVQMGPGRGFVDVSGFPDLKDWATRAEAQMEAFWPDATALLYSKGFITPNAVYVRYITGENLPPGATGGGVMTVDAAYARKHLDDTGLTVHEMAHVVQSGGSPGWLVEAVADYVRWIRFEPQNFTYRIDPNSRPQQPYRPGAAFLGWCELHYDSLLVTHLNDAVRFGHYSDALFEKYCGKDIDTLWKEFLAAYQADPKGVLTPPVAPSMRPRDLPAVSGTGTPVDLSYNSIGITVDGATFRTNGGFDEGGTAYSGTLLKGTVRTKGVAFRLAGAGVPDATIARGDEVRLSGSHRSLWLLAAAVEGGQHDETLIVTYDDGTTARFTQNFSDWAEPENFPGEIQAVRMPYRNAADGKHDENPFYVYAYGFPLDGTKGLRSVRLPNNPNVRVLAMTLAD